MSTKIVIFVAVICAGLLMEFASGQAFGANGPFVHHWQEYIPAQAPARATTGTPLAAPTSAKPEIIYPNLDDHTSKPTIIDELACDIYAGKRRKAHCRCILDVVSQFEKEKYYAHQTDELVTQKRSMVMAIKACLVRKRKVQH